jgi:hypothetical protein
MVPSVGVMRLLVRVAPAVLAGLALTACSAAVDGRGAASAGSDAAATTAAATGSAGATTAAPDGSAPASTPPSAVPTPGPGDGSGGDPGAGPGGDRGGATAAPRTTGPGRSGTPTPTRTFTERPSRSLTTAPPTPSNPSTVNILAMRAHCTSHQDPNGYATMAWSSTGGTKVYILAGRAAVGSADARASGGRGPYPYNGSATLPYNCSGASDFYRLDVYGLSSQGGITIQIPYGT